MECVCGIHTSVAVDLLEVLLCFFTIGEDIALAEPLHASGHGQAYAMTINGASVDRETDTGGTS